MFEKSACQIMIEFEDQHIIHLLNLLLRENISVQEVHAEFENLLSIIKEAGLRIEAIPANGLFAVFEYQDGKIIAQLHKRQNHLLIKNLIESYNLKLKT